MKVRNWSKYPNFKAHEFRCRHSGDDGMEEKFMDLLQFVRDKLDFPLIISSGYRSPSHPIESAKPHPGEHSLGLAADIQICGERALYLVDCALESGFRRVGVAQKGAYDERFIHLGLGNWIDASSYPETIWSY